MRYRYARGHSWRGKEPGSREWASHSIYLNPLTLLLGYGIWFCFAIPLWVGIEMYVLLFSGLGVLLAWLFEPDTRYHARFKLVWLIWYLTALEGESDELPA